MESQCFQVLGKSRILFWTYCPTSRHISFCGISSNEKYFGCNQPVYSLAWKEFLERMVHSQDRDVLDTELTDAVNESRPLNATFRIKPVGQDEWETMEAFAEISDTKEGGAVLGGVMHGIIAAGLDSKTDNSQIQALRTKLEQLEQAEERTQIMLDATPLCCNFWDENGNNIDCNLEAAKLFDLKSKQEYIDRFMELSPEFQPDGQLSGEKAAEKVAEAFETGKSVFEWMHQKLDGTPIPSEITLVRVKQGEKYIVAGYTRDLREFKKMLAKMNEANERAQIMLDATPLCCNFWDENFNNIDCNQEAAKLFDLKSKQEYLDRFMELSPEYQPDGQLSSVKAAGMVTEAFKNGRVVFEWMHRKLDGEPVPSEITLVRAKHGDHNIVVGYTRDLRESKRMLAEMNEANERAQIMLDATPLCCNFWDENFNNIDCNQEAADLFDLKDKQGYLDRFIELSPEYQPDGKPSGEKAGAMITEAFKNGRVTFDWMHQKLDGTPIPSEITLIRVKWGEKFIVAGYTRDMREFKKMLAEMNEVKERIQIMLDATPLGCNIWDKDLNNVDCNQEAANLFGLKTKQEYLDRFFELSPEFQPDGQRSTDKAPAMIHKAFETGRQEFEWMHQKPDGTPIPAEILLVRVRWGDRDVVVGYTRDLRQFKKMLADINEANERTQIMLDATPLCCNFWDENGNNIDCNLEAAKLFDLKDKQEYLDRFMELSPEYQPDGRLSSEKAAEKVGIAFRDGYARFEWMHQKLNGEPVPSEITLVRVRRGDRDIVVGYTRDMREFKKMLAEMRDADERTQIMLDATPLCCNLWDEQFNNIDCNLEAAKLFDLKSKAEYLERFMELSPEFQPDGRPSGEKAREMIVKAFETGRVVFEWMHQKLNGEPVPSEITLVRVKRGDAFIVAGYTRDLRELKKNEEALELDRTRTNNLLQLAQMTNAPEDEIVDFAIKSCVGLTKSTVGYVVLLDPSLDVVPFRSLVLDQSMHCLLPVKDEAGIPHTISPRLTECLETGQAVIHDDFAALPGHKFPAGHFEVHSHMNLPINDGDKPIGIIGVGNKEIPYTEMDVKQLTLIAQGLSSQLSRKRYSENLEKAKIEAEKANSAKSEFLAHMSHEIRTPLNGVIGLSDLLIGTPLNEKQQEYTRLINDSGKSLLFLINDILDFSKIEAGKLEIDSEDFDLPATVESVLGILASRAGGKNLELGITFCPWLPKIVRGDSGRIRQILLNLVSNAVKFTDRGGVRIAVDIEAILETEVLFRFSVIDTGIGIPEDRIYRLFKAFSQADASSARVYGGTGLGLAISMQLVHLMRGEIGVESVEGQGSTFWFNVPLGCDPLTIRCIESRGSDCVSKEDGTCANIDGDFCVAFAHHGIGDRYKLSGFRALVIDENEIQRETIRAQLENWGLDCNTCSSGKEAITLLGEKKRKIDLLIVDNTLADGTAMDFVQNFLGLQKKKTVEIPKMILLRPLSEEYDRDLLETCGAEAVSKPVFSSALFDAVMNQLFASEQRTKTGVGTALSGKSTSTEAPSKEPVGASSKSYLAGKIHVLVVEDNRVNQIVARNLLSEAGFSSDIAINGFEACDAVRRSHYDIVLMDCQMPEMDGYEATDLIRKWEREHDKKRIPIIALTANATREDVQKCFDAGMDAYCSKPINPEAMIRLIEEWHAKSNG